MNISEINTIIEIPHMIMISGNGRNVGKTALACQIIKYLSKKTEVIGIKISPHFHEIKEDFCLVKNDKYIISEEKQITSKDSSLMLQAGATKVYYIISKQENLQEAFEDLLKTIQVKSMVCESGGLREFVKPGIFLFVKKTGDDVVKKHILNYSPILVNNDRKCFDFDIRRIKFDQNSLKLQANPNE